MTLKDLFNIVWHNMWKRKLRTIFTMSGVVIGGLSIFIIMSISNGFEKYISESINNIVNGKTIKIYAGEGTFGEGNVGNDKVDKTQLLNTEALKELSSLDFVEKVIPIKNVIIEGKYKNTSNKIRIQSTSFDEFVEEKDILFGSIPTKSYEVVLDYNSAKHYVLTEKEIKELKQKGLYYQPLENEKILESIVGKTLEMFVTKYDSSGVARVYKKQKVKVVGVLKKSPSIAGWVSYADINTINRLIDINPILTSKEIKEQKDNNKELSVFIKDEKNLEENENVIKSLGYTTQTYLSMVKQIEKTIAGVKLILSFLGGTSLVVAALSITNTMEMAIYERNKEIGIMKVIGAKRSDIYKIFIGESCAIATLGGIIAIVGGFIANQGINELIKVAAKELEITNIAIGSFQLAVYVVLFSLFVGLLSGFMPAKKATKVDIIETLK